jgi:hypothetical protein
MSQPRDRRVFSSSAAVAEARSGLVSERPSTPPPQVTLEPLTSFKRSLEEIGFDTGPGDEPQLLQEQSQSTSTGLSSNSEAPLSARSRDSGNSQSLQVDSGTRPLVDFARRLLTPYPRNHRNPGHNPHWFSTIFCLNDLCLCDTLGDR